jgi:putative endonuclease
MAEDTATQKPSAGWISFVKKYAIDRLVFYENFEDVHEAIAHEKRLKKWRRDWKIRLVEIENPDWEDLSKNWHGLDEIR